MTDHFFGLHCERETRQPNLALEDALTLSSETIAILVSLSDMVELGSAFRLSFDRAELACESSESIRRCDSELTRF